MSPSSESSRVRVDLWSPSTSVNAQRRDYWKPLMQESITDSEKNLVFKHMDPKHCPKFKDIPVSSSWRNLQPFITFLTDKLYRSWKKKFSTSVVCTESKVLFIFGSPSAVVVGGSLKIRVNQKENNSRLKLKRLWDTDSA